MVNERSVNYYERIIERYEEGKIELDNDELLEIADEILGYDRDGRIEGYYNWYSKKDCEKTSLPKNCCECEKLKNKGGCDFIRAISLADYIYKNLVEKLPEDRKTLCDFLEGSILNEFFPIEEKI